MDDTETHYQYSGVAIVGVEGLFCGAGAIWGSIAIIWNDKYGRWVLPIGKFGDKNNYRYYHS